MRNETIKKMKRDAMKREQDEEFYFTYHLNTIDGIISVHMIKDSQGFRFECRECDQYFELESFVFNKSLEQCNTILSDLIDKALPKYVIETYSYNKPRPDQLIISKYDNSRKLHHNHMIIRSWSKTIDKLIDKCNKFEQLKDDRNIIINTTGLELPIKEDDYNCIVGIVNC